MIKSLTAQPDPVLHAGTLTYSMNMMGCTSRLRQLLKISVLIIQLVASTFWLHIVKYYNNTELHISSWPALGYSQL